MTSAHKPPAGSLYSPIPSHQSRLLLPKKKMGSGILRLRAVVLLLITFRAPSPHPTFPSVHPLSSARHPTTPPKHPLAPALQALPLRRRRGVVLLANARAHTQECFCEQRSIYLAACTRRFETEKALSPGPWLGFQA